MNIYKMITGTMMTACLALPAAAQNIQIHEVPGGEQAKRLVKMVRPVYPPEAKAAGVQGQVLMEAVIGKDGAVKTIRSVEGDPQLIPAAVEAIRQWTYQPTMLDGAPVEVMTRIHVNFTLAEAAKAGPAQRIRVSGNVQRARLVSQVQPVLPPEVKEAGITGTVKLTVSISNEGRPRVTFASGPPELIAPTVEAVKQWMYTPTLLNGEPVEVVTTIEVNYP